MRVGDRYTLSCGHSGRVIWTSDDETVMAVQGTRRSCPACYKNKTNPTVYLITT
jgi:hypothetical protein